MKATATAASALFLLAPSAAFSGTPADASAPDWDYVEFEVKSWGGPVTSWRILSNGGGSWTEAVRTNGQAPTTPASHAWHEIDPDAANYAALEAILRRLPNPAPDFNSCENFMSDMAYGTLRLTRGATTIEIAWNDGCLDDDYREFMGVLREAHEHMQALGKAAPVSRIEPPAGA